MSCGALLLMIWLERLRELMPSARAPNVSNFCFLLDSPPEREILPVEDFENAIAEIEERMNLTDQPRAIVFHEKEGRRHAHCVWSRFDASKMKAINLLHFKLKLRDMSRQLYLEHGWKMPRGLMNSEERNPLNFTQEEWQQAKRAKRDPQALKEMFKDCWAVSDTKATFTNALEERGFYLAKGDRRGHVAVDWQGEIYAISRYVGVKAKDVRARLGDANDLPSADEVKQKIGERLSEKLKAFQTEAEFQHEKKFAAWKGKRAVNDLTCLNDQASHFREHRFQAGRLHEGADDRVTVLARAQHGHRLHRGVSSKLREQIIHGARLLPLNPSRLSKAIRTSTGLKCFIRSFLSARRRRSICSGSPLNKSSRKTVSRTVRMMRALFWKYPDSINFTLAPKALKTCMLRN